MYLINLLTLQSVQQLFIAADRYRTGQGLVGVKNGVNVTFTTPGLEKFSQNLPFLSIAVFYNGVRLALLDDYMVIESNGVGTGFDTVLMALAPLANDHLFADYVIA